MAESEIEISLKWENDISFEMTRKLDDGDVKTIIKVEEDTDIANLWNSIAEVCIRSFNKDIGDIGTQMKA